MVFLDTQNLNDFLSSTEALNLNDDQFEINDVFLNNVSNNLFQCKYFDLHSQCFQILNNQLFVLHVNIRSLQKNIESFLDFLHTFNNYLT